MHREKRRYARMAMKAPACIQIGYQVDEGASVSLSMKGTFIVTSWQMAPDDVVICTIYHTTIRKMARVVRCTDQGMGLEFADTLLD